MSWNDERVELLRLLWTEGLSASQIAERLGGGISRNAVIGKVHRLKLESRARVVLGAAVADEAAPVPDEIEAVPVAAEETADIRIVSSQVLQMRAMPRSVGATALKFEEPSHEGSPTFPVVHEGGLAEDGGRTGAEIVPIARKLSLVQLSERTCKWPVGDPLKPDFHFCGHHAGDASPYCAYHARLAFQPSAERRRIR